MGNSSNITQSEFNKTWRVSDTLDHLTVWENKDDPSHLLEQYEIQDYDHLLTQQLYKMRCNSHYLVNAYALERDGVAFCQSPHELTKVFVEKIPLRLSNVRDIPYPDVIHLYDTCINGFQQLAREVGYFTVDEDFIGVNQQGHVRVWLNTAFENSSPLGSRDVSEAQMVECFLQLIHNATDHQSFPKNIPNLSDYMGIANNETTFESVRLRFVSFVREYNDRNVPLNLQCVHIAGGAHQVNSWCRNNSGFGFQQNSMRLSQKYYQSKIKSKVNQSTIRNSAIAAPAQYQSFYLNGNTQQNVTTAPISQNQNIETLKQLSFALQRTIQNERLHLPPSPPNIAQPVQYQSATYPTQFIPQPQIITTYSTQTPINQIQKTKQVNQKINSTNSPQFQYSSSRGEIRPDSTVQNQTILQQQWANPQAIQRNDTSKVSLSNHYIVESNVIISKNNQSSKQQQFQQTQLSHQNSYSFEKADPEGKKTSNVNIGEDGKSSPDFLALLSSLKNSRGQPEYTQVYSQVADTPTSYVKQASQSSSGKKYFNYPNIHETYSQDAFSSFGQDSNRNIESTVLNNFSQSNAEEDGDKYSGRYNFSKYDRAIDPELMADLYT